MEKILNQDEIDALFRATQKGDIGAAQTNVQEKEVTKFDLRAVGQISKEQLRSLSSLHENFARNISNSLGAYLRVGFDVVLVSVEQLSYSEVLSRLPELTYLCSVRIRSIEAMAMLQLDLSLAFPVIDLLLGGAGTGEIELRDLTEIEEQILETVVRIIARELQVSWAPVLESEFDFDQRQQSSQAQTLMSTSERTLALSFEIKMPNARGILNITIPAVASNALLRKLRAQSSHYKRVSSAIQMNQLRERMLDGEFLVGLRLPLTPLHVRDLSELKPGDVVPLGHPIDQPAVLLVAEKEMFLAYPVACGRARGGQIVQRNSILPDARRVAP